MAVLPSILLAGIPDQEADKAAGKKTLAVRLGKPGVALLALVFTWLAAAVVLAYLLLQVLPHIFGYLTWVVLPHALLLHVLIGRYRRQLAPGSRIDLLLVAALTYIIWFALFPFVNLL